MGSYFNQLILALTVVTVVVGLGGGVLADGQEPSFAKIDVEMAKLDQESLLKYAEDNTAENQLEAILRLADSSGDLAVTVPLLAKLSVSPSELISSAAAIALQRIGPTGAEHVRELIESADENEMAYGSTALKEMGGSKLYLEKLKKWTASPDALPRKRVLYALQGDDSGAVQMMDFLIESLEDPDFNVQCMACRVLAKLGSDAMPAEEQVITLFKTGNPSARSWAAVVIGAIGPTDKSDPAIMLGRNLNAPLQIEKQRSLLGLAALGPEASRVASSVRIAMNDENMNVMPHAAYTLWRITGEADDSLAVLGRLIDDPSYSDDAIELAGKMQSAAAPLVDKLMPKLSSDEPHVRELALVALGNIGPAAAHATASIQRLLNDSDALIRYAARESLKQINRDPEN